MVVESVEDTNIATLPYQHKIADDLATQVAMVLTKSSGDSTVVAIYND